ncbi:MAG: STT3 domain-containing protein [Dehalococcoidales bacterium]
MTKFKISPVLLIGLLIAVFFGISLLFRIYLPYNSIFVGDNIKYTSNDAYYYMRLVDNVSIHFPQLTQFDPYFIFPGGNAVTSLPFFHWIIAVLAWIVGGGHPTQHIIDVIGVYLPAIMGALTVIPVFFIGKALFNRWAGVLAAGLVAIFPGEFISRSMLGAADDPVAETLFTTIALAFLIYAIKTASQNQLTFSHILKRDWKIILKPLICSLFAGIFLGIYLITWQGALLFIFIIALYLVIQFIINHINHKSNDYLCIVSVITFLLALIILLIKPYSSDTSIAMIVTIFIPLALYGISKFFSSKSLRTFYYPLTIIGIGVIAAVIVYLAAPGLFSSLLDKVKFVFFPVGTTAATTTEMTPVLIPGGDVFTTVTGWGNFSTSFFFAPWWLIPAFAGAAICGYLFYSKDKGKSATPYFVFLILVTVMLLILTIQQLRTNEAFNYESVLFIPGVMFISLSILFYLFIKRGKDQPWYIATGWVIAILILFSLLILCTTFVDYRWFTLLPLAILIYILFKQRDGDEHLRLFLIWSLIILITLLIQRRFQYYFVVNAALLSGYLGWEIIRLSGINVLSEKTEDDTKKVLDFSAAPKKQNYYEMLGVSKNASYKEIKSAFRELAARYHLRPTNTPETETAFKELNKAYQTLTNPSQRASYDSSKTEATEKKKWKSRKEGHSNALYYVNVILAIVVVFLFVYVPNISKAKVQASIVPYALSDDWQIALLWMKDNTPEPLGDPNAYYQLYDAGFKYPESAYGVASWWDYGYWITRVAHRIPNTNPSQDPGPIRNIANYFLSQNLSSAEVIRKELGTSYIITDYDTSVGKYPAMVQWAGQERAKYVPTYYMAQSNQLVPVQVFSPDYYRTLIVRLYNFDGKAVPAGKPTVLVYQMAQVNVNLEVKRLVDYKEFTAYQDALNYIASQNSTTQSYDIVGTDPFVSPIPLEAVENYKEVFNSAASGNTTEPVKIFEYTGGK